MQPWTREKVLVEMFDILKNGRDDRLKINLLIFLEENSEFFFSTHPTVYAPRFGPFEHVSAGARLASTLQRPFPISSCFYWLVLPLISVAQI